MGHAIWTYVSVWGDFTGLALMQFALRAVVSIAYERLRQRIDDKVPDELREGGGSWIRSEVLRRDLDVRVLVAPTAWGSVDAYMPSAKTIILARDTFEKHDASFRAVAAHELGHALVYGRARVLGALFHTARLVERAGVRLATTLIFANLLYLRKDVGDLAHHALLVSVGAQAFVLVDEALASTIALRILARDRAVSRPAWIAGLTTLLAAFMTYLAAFVGQLFLLGYWATLIEHFDARRIACNAGHGVGCFTPAKPLPDGRLLLVTAFAVVVIALSVKAIRRPFKRPDFATSDEGRSWFRRSFWLDAFNGIFGTLIIALVWDQPFGPWFAVICVFGLVANRAVADAAVLALVVTLALLRPVVIYLLSPILGFLVSLLLGLAELMDLWEPSPSSPSAEPKGGSPESRRTTNTIEALDLDYYRNPPWQLVAYTLWSPALQLVFIAGLIAGLCLLPIGG